MTKQNKIQLKSSCVFSVPLQNYDDDFTFIVNENEFKTSRIVSDLLSPIICRIHSNDITFDTFNIITSNPGNFLHILNLVNFKEYQIPENEISFFLEVIEKLGNKSIQFEEQEESTEITLDNVFQLIKKHEKYSTFFSANFSKEIDFISSHFFELCTKTNENEFRSLQITTIEQIINNKNLCLESEDQLLRFINNLCENDSSFSTLYEFVLFINASSDAMKEFNMNYDIECMNRNVWNHLAERLECEIDINNKKDKNGSRYSKSSQVKSRGKKFDYSGNDEFNGIINFLLSQSNNQIENEIEFTTSTIYCNSDNYHPREIAFDNSKFFMTEDQNLENCWFCMKFKNHRIIPSNYSIKSDNSHFSNVKSPKSWVIEGSNDKSTWEILDEQKNDSFLKNNNIHTFAMNNQSSKEFQYIRMRLTEPNWYGNFYFLVDRFNIYGTLI